MLTLADVTRSNKVLSVSEQIIPFGENTLSHLDWVRPAGNVSDADSGYVSDFDGTITSITAHCENTNANSKDVHLFIDQADMGSIGELAGGSNVIINDTTLNIDFTQGQRIRLRAVGSSGIIHDTVIKLTTKWRVR